MAAPARAVFLSYASEDAGAARRICEALRAAGIEVWFDQSELRGGDAWDQRIRREIRDCALFVPIISGNTQARSEGYFRLEWHLADQRTHLMGKNRAFLVPVCVDETRDADADIPDSFAAVQWTHLPEGKTLLPFVERVARLLSPDKSAAPAPTLPAGGSSAAVLPPAPAGQTEIREKSIAVLPFANLSGDKDNEYFSDGLTEEILSALSEVEGLHVASRSSAFFFKGKAAEISEIANRLHVANLLEGSVRRAGNRIRITVKLVEAQQGFQLWSEKYDRQMEDIFAIQDDIARAITDRLRVTLGPGTRQSTTNLEAFEVYLKGRHHWHQRSPAAMWAAIRCFEQTIKLDPNYALAYAGLADCYGILRVYGWISEEAGRPPAQAAVSRAMALAPSLWEVNFSRGVYSLYLERAWREAEPHFEKAIGINARSSLAQVYYGMFLSAAGRADDAVKHSTLACELDPLSGPIHGIASTNLLPLGRINAAERMARHALELQSDLIIALWAHGIALSGLERHAEGIGALERVVLLSRTPIFVGMLGLGYARGGRPDDARHLLQEIKDRGSRGEYIPAVAPLLIFIGLGDLPGIRSGLSKCIAEVTSPISLNPCRYFLEAFRTDPEIDRLHIDMFGW
jgi:TolB-like protein